jgi:hypothetical protein
MPFLAQPSPFQGLGLAPPMAPIMVEAGEVTGKTKGEKNARHNIRYKLQLERLAFFFKISQNANQESKLYTGSIKL